MMLDVRPLFHGDRNRIAHARASAGEGVPLKSPSGRPHVIEARVDAAHPVVPTARDILDKDDVSLGKPVESAHRLSAEPPKGAPDRTET